MPNFKDIKPSVDAAIDMLKQYSIGQPYKIFCHPLDEKVIRDAVGDYIEIVSTVYVPQDMFYVCNPSAAGILEEDLNDIITKEVDHEDTNS